VTAPHLGPGHVIAGKYTIRSLLAFAGATATYHATDPQGGQVALKLLDPAIGQRADVMGALDRVSSECALLARHSVLPVLDAGYDVTTGAPFRATEFLTIPSLGRLVETGPLSEDVTAAIIRGASIALDVAHSRGMFHHALKPTNLFVGPAPHYPVLVSDFGTRLIHEAVPTQEMYSIAAPWLAPEQLYPGVPVGPQTDVYAMALLTFYALTGRSYWWSCQASPPDIQAWQQEIVAPHVPASTRARELGRGLNPALDSLFARALAVNPGERPLTVGEFAQLLSSFSAVAAPQAAPVKTENIPQYQGYPPVPAGHGYPPAQGPAPQPDSATTSGATVAFPMPEGPPGGQPPYGPAADPYAAAMDPQYGAGPAAPAGAALGAQAGAPQVTPGLPTFHDPAPKKKAGMLPVIIGVSAAVLVGGATVAFLFLRTPRSSKPVSVGSDSSASASSVSASKGSPDSSASSTASSAPAGSGSAEEKSDAGAPAEPDKTVDVKFVCAPGCDKILVDGEEVKDVEAPVKLLPGKHTVEASKQGYATKKDDITVELTGTQPVEKKIVLVPSGPTGPVTPGKKKCGKFLKRC